MATHEERKKIFSDLSWEEKISHLVKFYEAMIAKTDNEEYISKFQNTINKLQKYEENDINLNRVLDLYDRILQAEQKTQERKKKESAEQLTNGQKLLQQIKQQEMEEENEDADDFLQQQMSEMGI